MTEGIAVIGGGGHAKVVVDTLRATGQPISCMCDDDVSVRSYWAGEGFDVGTTDEALAGPLRLVHGVGSNAIRSRLQARVLDRWDVVIHPRAMVADSVTVGAGSVVFGLAAIQPSTAIGDGVIVNTAAVVEHDCVVGDFSHIAPSAVVAGGVTLGTQVLIGAGAVVLPGVSVGDGATIGAGAVVNVDVPAGVTAVGVPVNWSGGS